MLVGLIFRSFYYHTKCVVVTPKVYILESILLGVWHNIGVQLFYILISCLTVILLLMIEISISHMKRGMRHAMNKDEG